ncbi:alkaline phosphatase [Bradyrhizobium elkanii]|jgi:alkaline phosphatase|uniref:Alkaline phosphatase n=1 Tax=Bradyrhizobium elkanii TaxID=29448 RepID=A0A8I1Y579_BRAEL|nr:alkaline phosphatase [Bradyrhizobium elkanii]MBP1292244.1 alkaline phosphatase [Bradyrhizobium elkanii]MCP1927259.1 alkaline phosphatase [Bradyrhizobium elkanii]MCS3475223.1 alkaline phosphatase [Bradyrhizobium elkanii]MCS3582062.1 alkaline phosphatase [Bradyrhizobium elkanii]MCS3715629.1 alkaline phosphatase [Bradyrhizobium elkanii]
MIKRVAGMAVMLALSAAPAFAQTIYPIDRADILAGAKFDFKVELPGVVDQAKLKVTLNGADYAAVFGQGGTFTAREAGQEQSALLLRDVSLAKAGQVAVEVSDGTQSRTVTWTVYDTGARKARNVILFIGDGMSPSHRVAARILSKGIAEGKSRGKLAIDDMPHMALVATAGSDSIITDSANAASAYATGHKAAVNALGVYADRTPDPLDDPRVETIASLAKRRAGLAVGIVTNTEVEDATPAAMVAHTRRRAAYDAIVAQYFDAKPDVLMGGGSANFLPQSTSGSKRKDDIDYLARFRDGGYPVATTASELATLAAKADTRQLLGLFAAGNMDGALDRKFLKGGGVKKFPEQPDLTEQVRAALTVLSKHESGFFLMVESGLIDKYAHLLDMERAVYDTIMLDNAVRLAKDWAKARSDDTLILVVADHNHPNSLVGTINDDMTTPNVPLRERVGVYEKAGFPNYPAPNAEGYPSRVDVSRRLAIFSASLPDHYETFRPKLDDPNEPTVKGDQPDSFKANDKYKDVPGVVLRFGNLPAMIGASVHSGEDVILTATGPGSERVHGSMDNTEVFRVMVEALGLGAEK